MRPGPQAAEQAEKELLSSRPLTARPGWGGLAGVQVPGGSGPGGWSWGGGLGRRTLRGFLLSPSATRCWKGTHNRENAEKQKAFATISIGSVAWSLRGGHLGGGSERWVKGGS